MDGEQLSSLRSPILTTLKNRSHNNNNVTTQTKTHHRKTAAGKPNHQNGGFFTNAAFTKWGTNELLTVLTNHQIPCFLSIALFFFMWVEYTLHMISPSSPPFDIGFIATKRLQMILASNPDLNNVLAGLNTVFVAMQTGYILWTWLIEGRMRATISALFMFTCRGILGYSTQLPLPQEFVGSGADFPVGNVSFFLFYSGHVAAAVIASLDMRRLKRMEMAHVFDALNILQIVRLLASRGHYTIDLAAGIGAGFLFDSLAGMYVQSKNKVGPVTNGNGVNR
ncbi:phosphatidylcholine:diacylglycerol cholinephosphotransferase 1-like [Impatiens glandulifera]|uniref:phosphatidylcholine:diacylglycerol cholinephosphotransferase 1-like n=1 Tax=Impatiens glandulifera TaxID=253017 RepID=UPI001FB19225|nr:phosphatidylcholine:diacylglycerol cholinephosphotransferase 1-like [Impatiens glandulifera]